MTICDFHGTKYMKTFLAVLYIAAKWSSLKPTATALKLSTPLQFFLQVYNSFTSIIYTWCPAFSIVFTILRQYIFCKKK